MKIMMNIYIYISRIHILGFAVYAIGYTVFIFMINTHDTTSLCSTGRSSHRDSSSIFDEPCSYWILSILICTYVDVISCFYN